MDGTTLEMQPNMQGDGAAGVSGLSHLNNFNQISIQQVVEIAEVMTGVDMQNRYSVVNSNGWQFLLAREESDFCNRILCKEHRGFIMHVTDASNQEVLTLKREFNCCVAPCCPNPANRYSMTVSLPGDNLVGIVRQAQYCMFSPKLSIEAASGQELFRIEGPTCVCHGPLCFSDVPFKVFMPGGSEAVARISRVHAGLGKECFTKANNFKLEFLRNLDFNSKILIFSATFLIDMMFFEGGK